MKLKQAAGPPSGFRSRFLDGLTTRETRAVVSAAKQETISAHQILQREGEEAVRLWLLVTGRVAVYRLADNGDRLFLKWGVPGDTFGLATILRQPAHYLVTIEAAQESSILSWNLASCAALDARFPNLSKALYSVAAEYLDTVIDVLGSRAFENAEQRLARVVVENVRQLGRSVPEGIELDLTNEQLAVAAHISLFTATRRLSNWRRLGMLKKYRAKIVLPSLAPFERLLSADGSEHE
jgi:CRP/FNR family transcriptional regulator, nitrogen oxide reductase regulator